MHEIFFQYNISERMNFRDRYEKKTLSKDELVPLLVSLIFEELAASDKVLIRDELLKMLRRIMGSKMYGFVDRTIKAKSF